jgi:hypothetical protein
MEGKLAAKVAGVAGLEPATNLVKTSLKLLHHHKETHKKSPRLRKLLRRGLI